MSVEEKVRNIIVEQLGVSGDEVVPSASFVDDLGADSLDLVLDRLFDCNDIDIGFVDGC